MDISYNLINPEQITNVKVWIKRQNMNWHISSVSVNTVRNFFRRLIGMSLLKSEHIGYAMTYDIDYEIFSAEHVLSVEKDSYIEYDVVYYKPHIVINLSNGKYYTKYFETENELNKYLDENSLTNKLIRI